MTVYNKKGGTSVNIQQAFIKLCIQELQELPEFYLFWLLINAIIQK